MQQQNAKSIARHLSRGPNIKHLDYLIILGRDEGLMPKGMIAGNWNDGSDF
jgi:hypothetical protein